MQSPVSMLRSMLRWFRFSPHPRALSKQSDGNVSRMKDGAAEALSPERLREMFAAILADPEACKAVTRSLIACLPVQGGTCTSASLISPGDFGSGGCGTGNYTFPTNDNVGIGITTPAVALHIFAPTSSDSDAKYNLICGDSTPAGQGTGGGILFSGYYNGTTSKAGFANIRGVKENNTQGDYATALIFDTRANGGNQTERMRISSAGNLGIGTVAPQQPLTLGPSKVLAMEMVAPGVTSATGSSVGGTLPAGNYWYKVTAIDESGNETVAGTESGEVTVAGTTSSVTVVWSAVPGAYRYRIYRGQSIGGEDRYFEYMPTVALPTTFTDIGGTATIHYPPSATTAYTMKFNPSGNVQIGNQSGDPNAWQTVLLGTDTPKQSKGPTSFGPEMITAAAVYPGDPQSQNRRVVLWSGFKDDDNAMFLINSTGELEWGPGGTGMGSDQDCNLQRVGSHQLTFFNASVGFAANTNGMPPILLKYDGTGIFMGNGTILDFNVFRTGPDNTTDATPTSLSSTTITLQDQYAYRIAVQVVGRKFNSSDHAFFYQAALAYRQGGGAVVEGGTLGVVTIAAIKSSGAGSWACTIVASGNNVNVQVTGQASTSIDWSVTVEYQQVS
ncbi:MAG TPA: hypothetical protein VG028_08975 [Terriglobia bacterium]|nr:hypothetical protein [Terriglobia bacterium]